MQKKGILTDLSFWLLAGINVYMVWYYYHHHEVFKTLVWVYWCQSVLLGLFNFLDMLTVRTVQAAPNKDKPNSFLLRIPAAFFFLLHYGGFHFVYLFFVLAMDINGKVDLALFKYCVLAFFAGQLVQFIQNKIQQRKQQANLGAMLFTPYLRIIPMHLTILLPNILKMSNVGIFLILKCVTDIAMYILTKPSNKDKNTDAAVMATQQTTPIV